MKIVHQTIAGKPPRIDMNIEKKAQEAVLKAIQNGWINSAHDIADGGLATALAECCIINRQNQLGLNAKIISDLRPDYLLFSETQSRFILSADETHKQNIIDMFNEKSIPIQLIGETGGTSLQINNILQIGLSELNDLYYSTLPELMSK